MASIPCSSFCAPRVHQALNQQHAAHRLHKIPSEKGQLIDPCAALDASGQSSSHGRPPIVTYFIKDDQMFTQTVCVNPDGSTSVVAVPVDDLTNICSPGVLIRSDKFDPTTVKQADLKPVPSSSSPGIGPRKG